MKSLPTKEEPHSPVVNRGDCTAFIKKMNMGSASSIFNLLQKSVDRLFRRSWKNRLQPDYLDILKRAYSPPEFKSEEDFFTKLSGEGILIDGGGKWFSLDKDKESKEELKKRGAKRYVISARKLSIAWSDDKRYYRWITLPQSERCKFEEVAKLLDVCWLDIAGSIDCRDLSPKTNYGAYLILKFDNDRGLDVQPAQICVEVGGTMKSGTAYLRPNKEKQLMMKRLRFLYDMQVLLTNPSKYVQQQEIEDDKDEEDQETVDEEDEEDEDNEEIQIEEGFSFWGKETEDEFVLEDNGGESLEGAANDRNDGWMEIELGTFSIDGDDHGKVKMSLKETGGHWKSGLIIEGIEVRPVSTEKPKKR